MILGNSAENTNPVSARAHLQRREAI